MIAIPFALKLIRRKYPNPGKDRQPIPPEVMLRIYFMQQWNGLSDLTMGDSLYHVESMRHFAGVDLGDIPHETTICRCRHFLERPRLTEALFRPTEEYFSEWGLLLSEGTIVDATIVKASSSTKSRVRQQDQVDGLYEEEKNWHLGLKAHVGNDPQERVQSAVVTLASVLYSEIMEDCVHGIEEVIHGDKAYVSAVCQQQAESDGVNWCVLRKANRGRKLTWADPK